MLKQRFILMLSITLLAGLFIVSCQKEKEPATTPDMDMTEKSAMAESTFDELTELADQAYGLKVLNLKNDPGTADRLGDCATITLDTTVMPRVLTIDFGEENCLCRDGKWRRGKIIVTFNGRYHQPGTVITHSFENYYVNDNHVEGQRVLTNHGPNSSGYPEISIVSEGTITFNQNGLVLTMENQRLRTWIEGYDQPGWWNNVFLITGSGSHNYSNGNGFTRTITEPLRREATCHHFVSGTVETIPQNTPARILDYGDGECDNIATITIDGQTYTIRLK
jgi:hypothetical protein